MRLTSWSDIARFCYDMLYRRFCIGTNVTYGGFDGFQICQCARSGGQDTAGRDGPSTRECVGVMQFYNLARTLCLQPSYTCASVRLEECACEDIVLYLASGYLLRVLSRVKGRPS